MPSVNDHAFFECKQLFSNFYFSLLTSTHLSSTLVIKVNHAHASSIPYWLYMAVNY